MEEWFYEKEWFEETNVARKIKNYLQKNGYQIIKFNENKKEKGPDIIAKKDNIEYIIEVKGYPSDKYVKGKKKGQKKPTKPDTQAKHWFAEALLQVLLAKSKNPNAVVCMAFPKFQVYERLISRLKYILTKNLGINCYLVDEKGKVKEIKN